MKAFWIPLLAAVILCAQSPAFAQRCDIPREARDIWRCENGFVIGPENVIIRLPIPETDPEALYNAGIEAAQRGDWRVAIAYFTAAHQRAHLVPRYMYNLGLAHARAGNAAPAVAWLVAYLIAEPEAANRSTVWTEIRRQEEAIHEQSALLLDQAEAAARLVPRATQTAGDSVDAQSNAFGAVAEASAGIGDYDRARRLFQLSRQAALASREAVSDANMRAWTRGAALADSDLETVNELTDEIGAPVTGENMPAMLAELERGGINSDLCGSFWMQHFRTFLCPDFPWWWPQNMRDQEGAIRTGNRDRIIAASYSFPISLALTGQQRRAATEIANGNNGFIQEEQSALVAEVLLRTNSAPDADRFITDAERYQRSVSGGVGVTDAGWFAARARALSLAERGQIQEAVDTLELYSSRRLGNWPNGWTPHSAWLQSRYDGLVIVGQYLIDRGRAEQAAPLLERLDSLRQARAAAHGLAAVRQEVTDRTRLVEQAVILATTLPGVCYDLEWEIEAIRIGRGNPAGGYGPFLRVYRLGDAALGLERGLRRMRAAYERAGRHWGE